MQSSKRFHSLADVQRHRELLRARREAHAAGIKQHWDTLGEPEFRKGVMSGAMRSIWKAWSPVDMLKSMSGEPSGLTGILLGMALGSRARTGWGRLLTWAAGAAVPVVADRLKEDERAQHLLSELGRSWERLKAYVRQRREAHRERQA